MHMMDVDFKIMPQSNDYPQIRYASVYDAYNRPSERKQYIWKYWYTKFILASESATDYIGIMSSNFAMFTIGGVVTIRGIKIGFIVTKTRYECWEIVENLGGENES